MRSFFRFFLTAACCLSAISSATSEDWRDDYRAARKHYEEFFENDKDNLTAQSLNDILSKRPLTKESAQQVWEQIKEFLQNAKVKKTAKRINELLSKRPLTRESALELWALAQSKPVCNDLALIAALAIGECGSEAAVILPEIMRAVDDLNYQGIEYWSRGGRGGCGLPIITIFDILTSIGPEGIPPMLQSLSRQPDGKQAQPKKWPDFFMRHYTFNQFAVSATAKLAARGERVIHFHFYEGKVLHSGWHLWMWNQYDQPRIDEEVRKTIQNLSLHHDAKLYASLLPVMLNDVGLYPALVRSACVQLLCWSFQPVIFSEPRFKK